MSEPRRPRIAVINHQAADDVGPLVDQVGGLAQIGHQVVECGGTFLRVAAEASPLGGQRQVKLPTARADRLELREVIVVGGYPLDASRPYM